MADIPIIYLSIFISLCMGLIAITQFFETDYIRQCIKNDNPEYFISGSDRWYTGNFFINLVSSVSISTTAGIIFAFPFRFSLPLYLLALYGIVTFSLLCTLLNGKLSLKAEPQPLHKGILCVINILPIIALVLIIFKVLAF